MGAESRSCLTRRGRRIGIWTILLLAHFVVASETKPTIAEESSRSVYPQVRLRVQCRHDRATHEASCDSERIQELLCRELNLPPSRVSVKRDSGPQGRDAFAESIVRASSPPGKTLETAMRMRAVISKLDALAVVGNGVEIIQALQRPNRRAQEENYEFATGQLPVAVKQGVIGIDETVEGSTSAAGQDLYNDFLEAGVGGAGQALYTLEIPAGSELDVTISTCDEATTFDTYLVVFKGGDLKKENLVAESNNDFHCDVLPSSSTTTVRMQEGLYTILITGSGLERGTFKLSVTSQAPTPTPLPWGKDRIDQRQIPLDGKYTVSEEVQGESISVYVMDSGVRRTHVEFDERAEAGYDFSDTDSDASDCSGFGTHTAGIIGGKHLGVASKVRIIPVRILDCGNTGKVSDILSAFEWILHSVQAGPSGLVPAVIFLRFVSDLSESFNNAVRNVVKFGIPIIVPAGDSGNGGFCNSTSPASSNSVLVVGATSGPDDIRADFSNYGECVNIYAPGVDVPSASHTSDTAIVNQSGTAQAAAHVAGIASVMLSMNQGIEPSDLTSILSSLGTVDVVKNGSAQGLEEFDESRMAYVRSVPETPPDAPPERSVFIYSLIRLANPQSPAEDPCGATALGEPMADLFDVAASRVQLTCFAGQARQDAQRDTLLRVTETERKTPQTSSRIRAGLKDNNAKEALGGDYEVVEDLWFVDSSGFVFWAEPQFTSGESEGLSPGAIAGVAVGIVLVLLILAIVVYCVFRHFSRVDDIQSMEGSADFEKGPTHFDDYANQSTKEQGAMRAQRSFRGALPGRSKSHRQSSNRGNDGSLGTSRMDSYRGVRGADQGGGTDILRMHSYGAEAFAGLGGLSRGSSFLSTGGGHGGDHGSDADSLVDQRAASFRGKQNLMGLKRGSSTASITNEPDSGIMGNVRMHSMGGEAFASIARQLSEISKMESGADGGRDAGGRTASTRSYTGDPSLRSLANNEQLLESLDRVSPRQTDGIDAPSKAKSFFGTGG